MVAGKQDYSYSMDKEGHLIHVKDAVKGNDYYCPCCREVMVPKQGKKNRWHFAHKVNLENCSYETYLHKVAKKRICECFNESRQFLISYNAESTCSVSECPLGVSQPCTWNSVKEFDLKQYYNKCQEEAEVGRFRADLLLCNSEKPDRGPILIEIYVTHKSTEEKLKSGYRIIEICIDSEEDIDRIVSGASIKESGRDVHDWNDFPPKIRFYNFKADLFEKPDRDHQQNRHIFWIDEKGDFHFSDSCNNPLRCLDKNLDDVENSIFRIESRHPIEWNFTFGKLVESRLGIKCCTMCSSYKKCYCSRYSIYTSDGMKHVMYAMNCPYFKQIDYSNKDMLYKVNHEFECKITRGAIQLLLEFSTQLNTTEPCPRRPHLTDF